MAQLIIEEQKNQNQNLPALPSAWSLIIQSFGLYRRTIKSVFLVGLVPAIIVVADYMFTSFGLMGMSALMGLLSVIVALFFYPALIIVITSENSPSGIKSASLAYKESRSLLGSYLVLVSLMAVAVAGGLLILIIPAIYVGIMLSLSPFAWIIEGKKGKDALAASWFYIKGNWWKISWRYLLAGIILAIIQGFVSGIFSSFFPSQPISLPAGSIPYNVPASLLTVAAPEVTLIVSLLSYFFSAPIMVALGFKIYQSLKNLKTVQIDEVGLASGRKSVSRFIILGIVAMILLIIIILGAFSFALFQLKGLM